MNQHLRMTDALNSGIGKYPRPLDYAGAKTRGAFATQVARWLRQMGQHVEANGISKFAISVAVAVVAGVLLAALVGGFGAMISLGKLDQKVTDGFCYMNQRLDRLEHSAPRQC